jgi:hypothetical protein
VSLEHERSHLLADARLAKFNKSKNSSVHSENHNKTKQQYEEPKRPKLWNNKLPGKNASLYNLHHLGCGYNTEDDWHNRACAYVPLYRGAFVFERLSDHLDQVKLETNVQTHWKHDSRQFDKSGVLYNGQ